MPRSVVLCGMCGSAGVYLMGRLGPACCSKCRYTARHCVDCGERCSGASRCRACDNAARVIRSAADRRVTRRMREQEAPGLTRRERELVLAQWKRQARRCSYCESLATTVDHVVPLVRGGTNYEGNLAPACKSCNSRKCHLMLVEWRTGRRLPPMSEPLPWARPAPKPIKAIVGEQRDLFRQCIECGSFYDGRAGLCSSECRRARDNRAHRERYEPKVHEPRVTSVGRLLLERGTVTKAEAFDVLGTDPRSIRRALARLVATGFATRELVGGVATWRVGGCKSLAA